MENVILYSINCPKCKVLEAKLKQKGVVFTIIDNVDTMVAKGISSTPFLEIDGKLMNFTQAIQFVNSLEVK